MLVASLFIMLDLVQNALNSARETSAAEPIANPLPIAAVVLPAASSVSVTFLVWLNSLLPKAISAIPPALSEIGPKPSIVKAVAIVDSMPRAEIAIPYMPAFT